MSYRTRKWGAVHDTTSESNLVCIFQLVSHRDATRYHRQLDPQLLQLTVNIKVSRITLHCSAEGKYNFLNAAGGTLYIGVSDAGAIIGLKEDYTYMVCNSDAYERFIRQRIIATMGKDINSIIKIEFPRYGNREICCVTVPCYGKLIELKGKAIRR